MGMIVGVDPHKKSGTLEVVDEDGKVAATGRAADVFAGTTVADVDLWERDDQIMDRVWRAATSDLADGWSRGPASTPARYPVLFLGQRRCVLVVWDSSSVSVERHTGAICERLTP